MRSFLDNLTKENRALQELNATLEITARDSVAAKNYIEQHRNQLESALVAAKDQVRTIISLNISLIFMLFNYFYFIIIFYYFLLVFIIYYYLLFLLLLFLILVILIVAIYYFLFLLFYYFIFTICCCLIGFVV